MSMNLGTDPSRLGKYTLLEKLGHGGVAEVWRAFDSHLHRYVAIKLLHTDLQADPEFMTRFSLEARFIASLHHPNIVQIHDFQMTQALGTDTPVAYMVMDYVEGETLAHYIDATSRVGKFPAPVELVQLFASIGKAIDYAHSNGMIHRDIKPANLLLDKRHVSANSIGEPILTDFGIAKILGTGSTMLVGNWSGTPLYISPEQAQGYPGDERSDLYSLGVILYEMCTGVCPFHSDGVTAVLTQQISAVPPSPTLFNPGIPPALASVILRALAKDPEERFSSALALTLAIAEAFRLPLPASLAATPSSPNMRMGSIQLLPGQSPEPSPAQPSSGGQWFQPSPSKTSPEVQWSQPLPVMNALPSAPASFSIAPQLAASLTSRGEYPNLSLRNTPVPPAPLARPFAAKSTLPPTSPLRPAAQPPVRSGRSWKWSLITLFLLLAVVAGSTLAVIHNSARVHPASAAGGTLTFADSGQYDPATIVGYNDIVNLSLHNLPPPQTGMAYFAWLRPDAGDDVTPPLLLGRLSLNAGNVTLHYASPTYTNLLAQYSGVRVIEEPASNTPDAPSQDPKTWRWEGWIPHTPTPGDASQYSMLSHIRHLLAKDPTLQANQIPGGLVIWTTRNVTKVGEWSSAAQGSWADGNATLVHQLLLRILDYLDGKTYVGQDVPAGSPWLVDPVAGKLGLLNSILNQEPPGYLLHIDYHLTGIVDSPGHTQEQRDIAVQVDAVITRMLNDLLQVRKDAVQLIQRSNAQLLQRDALTLLNEIASLSAEVNSGWFDPTIGADRGGVVWLNAQMRQLAAISVQAS